MGTFLPGTEIPNCMAWYGARTPCSEDIPPEFLSTTGGCGTSLFCICAPSTSLDRCGFFNSIVVKFPFNSISDSSEWWLFYSCNFDVVVQRYKPCLPMLSSRPEVQEFLNSYRHCNETSENKTQSLSLLGAELHCKLNSHHHQIYYDNVRFLIVKRGIHRIGLRTFR